MTVMTPERLEPVTFTVKFDASKLVAALEKIGKVARVAGWKIGIVALLMDAGTGAGAQARMYIRGGMDPAYADPKVRDAYAQVLAVYSPDLAAWFLRGWVQGHPDTGPRPVNAWHRLIGDTRIEVGAEA